MKSLGTKKLSIWKGTGVWLAILVETLFFGHLLAPLTHGENTPLPSFGKGPTAVRIYTDYFCPPCRNMESSLEPLIADLIKEGKTQVTFVDAPFSSNTILFARYFLYSLAAKGDFDSALSARNALFEAAEKGVVQKDRLEELLDQKRISFKIWNLTPVFNFWNGLLKEDKIRSTPSCVIVNGEKKETFVGSLNILKALENLKEGSGEKKRDSEKNGKTQANETQTGKSSGGQ